MKKLTFKHKLYLLYIRDLHEKKRINRKHRKKNYGDTHPFRSLVLPSVLDFSEDSYEETVNFFHKLREISDEKDSRFQLDFVPLKKISPAAALFLTSEIDRFKVRSKHIRIKVKDFSHWDSNIRCQLRDMGMFDLLNIRNIHPKFLSEKSSADEEFIKFKSGRRADGEIFLEMRDVINEKIGNIPEAKVLQKGITEAMTNTSNHAYPESYMKNCILKVDKWWLSSSINKKTKTMTVIICDQGVSIPKTIPENKIKLNILNDLFGKSDAQLIQIAVNNNKSQTNKSYRGKGLKDIKDYTKKAKGASLRIISRYGEYVAFSQRLDYITDHKSPILGTLIEWKAIFDIEGMQRK